MENSQKGPGSDPWLKQILVSKNTPDFRCCGGHGPGMNRPIGPVMNRPIGPGVNSQDRDEIEDGGGVEDGDGGGYGIQL